MVSSRFVREVRSPGARHSRRPSKTFWIDDPTRTDLAQYPPAFPALVALIYKVTGEHSAYSVQLVLWFADLILSLSADRRHCCHCFWAGALQSRARFLLRSRRCLRCTPHILQRTCPRRGLCWRKLAVAACCRTAQEVCALARRRSDARNRVLATRKPVVLVRRLGHRAAFCSRKRVEVAIETGAAVLFGTVIVISPIVIRNYLVFPDFTPTGGTIGVNLWEGLGEIDRPATRLPFRRRQDARA